MGMKLETELKLYGCDVGADMFEETLANLMGAMFPNRNSEQLLYYPYDALRFCEAVRSATRCQGLPDEMILRRLQNIRKRG